MNDIEKLKEVLNEAIEAGREAQLMVNLLLSSGARLGPVSMATYNKLHRSCAIRTRKINEFFDSLKVNP